MADAGDKKDQDKDKKGDKNKGSEKDQMQPPRSKKGKTESDEERRAKVREQEKEQWEKMLKAQEQRRKEEEERKEALELDILQGRIDDLFLNSSFSYSSMSGVESYSEHEATGKEVTKTPRRGVKRPYPVVSTPYNTSSSSVPDTPNTSSITTRSSLGGAEADQSEISGDPSIAVTVSDQSGSAQQPAVPGTSSEPQPGTSTGGPTVTMGPRQILQCSETSTLQDLLRVASQNRKQQKLIARVTSMMEQKKKDVDRTNIELAKQFERVEREIKERKQDEAKGDEPPPPQQQTVTWYTHPNLRDAPYSLQDRNLSDIGPEEADAILKANFTAHMQGLMEVYDIIVNQMALVPTDVFVRTTNENERMRQALSAAGIDWEETGGGGREDDGGNGGGEERGGTGEEEIPRPPLFGRRAAEVSTAQAQQLQDEPGRGEDEGQSAAARAQGEQGGEEKETTSEAPKGEQAGRAGDTGAAAEQQEEGRGDDETPAAEAKPEQGTGEGEESTTAEGKQQEGAGEFATEEQQDTGEERETVPGTEQQAEPEVDEPREDTPGMGDSAPREARITRSQTAGKGKGRGKSSRGRDK